MLAVLDGSEVAAKDLSRYKERTAITSKYPALKT
jgi:hypothetical protein